MSDTAYGRRVRAREAFNRSVSRRILGKDAALHTMNIRRKSGNGVGRFANITRPLAAAARAFIRARLRRATKEAIQREWIGANPFAEIRRRISIS
jgi:hypothetical protein